MFSWTFCSVKKSLLGTLCEKTSAALFDKQNHIGNTSSDLIPYFSNTCRHTLHAKHLPPVLPQTALRAVFDLYTMPHRILRIVLWPHSLRVMLTNKFKTAFFQRNAYMLCNAAYDNDTPDNTPTFNQQTKAPPAWPCADLMTPSAFLCLKGN